MKRPAIALAVCALVVLAGLSISSSAEEAAKVTTPKTWSMNATIIEACSCPMFCQCYFSTKPAAHAATGHAGHAGHAASAAAAGHDHGGGGGEHYCKFNNAYRVNKGRWGDVKLDGIKFWAAGDLGDDFGDGTTEWLVLTFDPGVTPEQREAVKTILGHVYPVQWKSFSLGQDAPIEWKATKDRAEARLDGGKAAEVVLSRYQGMSNEPIVITNLRYFGAPRNDGFVLMPNEVEAYRLGEKAYEFRGTNGFMITFDIKSEDVVKPQG